MAEDSSSCMPVPRARESSGLKRGSGTNFSNYNKNALSKYDKGVPEYADSTGSNVEYVRNRGECWETVVLWMILIGLGR